MSLNKMILMDIGNSRLKVYKDEEFFVFVYNDHKEDELFDFLKSIDGSKILYSSSNPRIQTILHNFLSNDFINIKDIISDIKPFDFSEISGMGTDRKLSLIGAYNRSKNNVVTIDAGTATTINLMNSEAKCLGGFIVPGLETQSLALNKYTSSLPKVEIKENEFNIGKDTNAAILNGIIYGSAGIVKELLERSINESFKQEEFEIYLTGGQAPLLTNPLKDWKYSINLQEHLLIQGLKAISEQGLTL